MSEDNRPPPTPAPSIGDNMAYGKTPPDIFQGWLVLLMLVAILVHAAIFGTMLMKEKAARVEAEEQMKLWSQANTDCRMQLRMAEEGCRD